MKIIYLLAFFFLFFWGLYYFFSNTHIEQFNNQYIFYNTPYYNIFDKTLLSSDPLCPH